MFGNIYCPLHPVAWLVKKRKTEILECSTNFFNNTYIPAAVSAESYKQKRFRAITVEQIRNLWFVEITLTVDIKKGKKNKRQLK